MAQYITLPEFDKFKTNNPKGYFICNVCRLCANVSDNVVPIFDKIEEKGSVYAKLKKCLPSILVLESDIKPKQICSSCVSRLDSCFSFIEMSLDADFKFEALLQNKLLPQIQIVSDDKSTQVETPSWTPIKQECDDIATKSIEIPTTISTVEETKQPQQLTYTDMSILCQQLSFQPQTCVPESTLSTVQFQSQTNDIGLLVSKQDSNHNVISSQDLILLVEVNRKGGTNNFVLTSKKAVGVGQDGGDDDCTKITSINDLMNFHSNEKMPNVEGFTDEVDVGNKVSITLEGGDGQNSTESTAVLKALDADIMNILKMDGGNTTGNGLHNMEKPAEQSQQFDVRCTNEATGTVNVSKAGTRKSQPSTSEDLHCPVCGRGFTRRNRLSAHVARHSSERPFSCDKCDQRFITRWDLTLHLRIHSGTFTCEFCGKAFPAKGKLERHRRTHTGERPFPCTICGKAFSEKRNLDNHSKTHSAAASNVRKSRVNYANVFLSCGHLGTMSEDGARKSCLTCDKTNTEETNEANSVEDNENDKKINYDGTNTDENIHLINPSSS